MARTPVEIVKELLSAVNDPLSVKRLCAPDVTYVSLNYDNPDLKKLMPWCGTGKGPQAISEVFRMVGEYWQVDSFDPTEIFGEGENVAVFGRFTYTSTVLRKQITTPFAVFLKVKNEKVTYMQFMEDTFCTSSSFRSGGHWTFKSNPNGEEVTV